MKEFVVKEEPKATVKIGDLVLKFRTPTRGEARDFAAKARKHQADEDKMQELMDEFCMRLGNCTKENLDSLPVQVYLDLFEHLAEVEESKKK